MPNRSISNHVTTVRPKTCPNDSRFNRKSLSSTSRQLTSNAKSRGISRNNSRRKENASKDDEYTVELLEYEWPDLPPLPCMKDAITRQRVSGGISYVLPVDKGQNSINNTFRTDLRAMFKEPYSNDDMGFNDTKIAKSATVHFDTNAVDTKWTQKDVDNIPVQLNYECEKVRKQYARSAPVRGSKGSGIDPDKLKTRSSLFLPMKREEHPEAQKLRADVEQMLQSVYLDTGINEDVKVRGKYKDKNKEDDDIEDMRDEEVKQLTSRKLSYRYSITGAHSLTNFQLKQKEKEREKLKSKLKLTANKFKTYDQLKRAKLPKLTIPERFKSKFLDKSKNQTIWDWLHQGEEINEFQFFLSICG